MTKILRILAAASLLTGLCSSYATSAPPNAVPQLKTRNSGAPTVAAAPPSVSEQFSPDEKKVRKDWKDSMIHKAAPKNGCFNAAYPSKEWKDVPCVKAPNIPALPRHGPPPAVVGNNNDISAGAPSGHITQAIGHFENVTNVTSESGPIANSGPAVTDAYTLQINTDFFPDSTACAGSPNPSCKAWEQWIFWNNGSSTGSAAMQYWLIAYNANCPTGQNWNQIPLYGGTYCWKNSANAVSMPNQPITNMANWTFTGTATSTADSVAMSTGSNVYTVNGDNAVSASTGWNIAEFNIFGYGGNSSGGGTASFNAGASATTRTEIIYGGNSAPNCMAQGFTAEMNNLSFGPTAPSATAPGPAVIFEESIAGGATSNCAAASTIGDTHLRTFNGLFYDFQASGDFTLAEIDPGFLVQTRQVSGAPMWPDATVNKAVAVRVGKSEVAICPAPTARDNTPLVRVDGRPTLVNDGQSLSLPQGGWIQRRGNVYLIRSETGDSVSTTVNSYNNATWLDVSVGLGRWPVAVKGLIANANGNVNQIATRDNFILTNAFNFDELYHRFADSWRVAPEMSMLSVCGSQQIERAAPKHPFYAANLKAAVRERANGVCTAAGVKPGPLLDACTLDVAVIGQDAAAKAFVHALPPAAVGSVVGGGATGASMVERWWWLLLVLLAFIVIVWLLVRRAKATP